MAVTRPTSTRSASPHKRGRSQRLLPAATAETLGERRQARPNPT
jgi:hypothetical protein